MKKYDLVVCAIALGEAEYLPEFLEFHLLQGVQHFYININNPIDATPDILAKYKDVVTIDDYPLEGEDQYALHTWQLKSYRSMCQKAIKTSNWIAVIDIDEFLVSPSHASVPEALKLYKDPGLGAVAIKWAMHGDSGHRTKTPGLVIERFTWRQEGTHPHCKTIFKSSHYKDVGYDCHTMQVKGLVVNERKIPCTPLKYAVDYKPGTFDILRLHHMHIKSYEEAMARLALRNRKATEVKDKEHFYAVDNFREYNDTSLLKYAPAIKENIRKRGL